MMWKYRLAVYKQRTDCLMRRHATSIGPWTHQGIKDVCQSDDEGHLIDSITGQPVWITTPILALMLLKNHPSHSRIGFSDLLKQTGSVPWMLSHVLELCFCQRPGLVHQRVRQDEHPEIVQQSG